MLRNGPEPNTISQHIILRRKSIQLQEDYSYDAKTSKMTITYDSKKTSPDMLRQQISKLGYNADNVKADAAARAKLPACCQVEKKAAHGDGCDQDHCGHHHSGCSGNHGSCNTQKK